MKKEIKTNKTKQMDVLPFSNSSQFSIIDGAHSYAVVLEVVDRSEKEN